jgi:chromosome segregation protein
MHLKSIEMFGFKSFADKTKIQFERGLTVVVGPNGCGKSNVVDAVKWVLGEKQARNIRGDKMEDVIFSGTDQRKPLSLSEVSLVLDNSDHILDFDSDNVIVTRRVFRDGESEYLINKSPVRLKDIEQLFMDTGIGKAAYSVMEQGKIDLILSTRAEERRYVFEEAAGISRYKVQKKESLKKLHDTSENLERINDIIKEIEREKDLKSRQADKTKEYFNLKEKLKRYDIQLNLHKYRELTKRNEKLADDNDRLVREREELSKKVSMISSENERDEKRKNDIQLQLFEWDKKLHTYRIKVEDIDSKTDKNRSMIDEHKKRTESLRKNIHELNGNMERLGAEREKSIQSGNDIQHRIQEDKKRLEEFYASRKRKIENIHGARDKIEQNKKNIKENENRLRELRNALEVVIKRLVDAIEKRKAELEGSEQERQEVRGNIYRQLKEIEHGVQQSMRHLKVSMHEEALKELSSLEVSVLRDYIEKFESYEDGFRSILFDKTGVHAEKEDLDRKIHTVSQDIDSLRGEINMLEEHIRNEQEELEGINGMITRVEKDLSRNENEKDWIEKHVQSLDRQIQDIQKQVAHFQTDLERTALTVKELENEIDELEGRLVEFNEKSEDLRSRIADLSHKRSEIEEKIVGRKSVSRKDTEQLQRLVERISSLDKSLIELQFRINAVEEYLWTEYEVKIADVKEHPIDESRSNQVSQDLQNVKKQIQELGPINNLAIEEYKDLKKRFEYYINQKNDIEKAREDIISVIGEINQQSIDMFLQTFKEIEKNFSEIFRQLFNGGNATIELTDVDNVLESGIDIIVRPPGKKNKNINVLSGGERSLIAVSLLFAIYMVKASPFCFLDEIDAALDEENIGRFIRLLQRFSRTTQFVIVSHNKKTMSVGDTLYGVTMEEPGVSKVVSFKMDKGEKDQPVAATSGTE